MIISLLINGLSTQYIFAFLLSLFIFSILFFLFLKLISNTNAPMIGVELFFLDITIMAMFFYSVCGSKYRELVSVAVWAIVPFRNLLVIGTKKFNITSVL
jgi:hypothetical protein